MARKVPFIPNEPDDLHCLQASYMMIAKYFDPSFNISMPEWSKITAFDKSTWASAGLMWFKGHSYDVKHVTLFDYERFIKDGAKYLIDLCGPEVADWQITHSNIPDEVKRAKMLLDSGIVERREPIQADIKDYLDNGYLIRILVNYCKLAEVSGYAGHAVVLYDYDDNGVFMHDPGLPPLPSRYVTWNKLESAWADPGPDNKELDAIKKLD
ncbi:MAG: hypothetical protein ABI220_05385 [Candidatus Saccharimonadales bacterium]